MFNRQAPIGTGFGPRTTAQDVLEGQDLSAKTAIVTGGHSGLGLETTRALASAGVRVIVGARNLIQAREAVGQLKGVEIWPLDLSDLSSVRNFTDAFLHLGRRADMVVNSAGVMACPEARVGPGWEAQFATNHLGHYALVNLLWPALVEGARVVSVSSAGHHHSAIRWDDVQFERGYDKWLAYGQSKTANALFAVHLDAIGRSRGIRAFSLHPGSIMTPLQRHIPLDEMIALGWADAAGNPAHAEALKTPAQGAATQVWAATSPQLDGMGGWYCEDCDIAAMASESDAALVGVREHAIDPDQAQRLWALSAELTGIDALSV